jgi:hypothetical protein
MFSVATKMINYRIDVILQVKFVGLANVPKGNFTCLYFELQHLP